MRTLNISGETEALVEQRAQNTLELLPLNVRTSTLLCIYRSQVSTIVLLLQIMYILYFITITISNVKYT